jgi:hypothetical protein
MCQRIQCPVCQKPTFVGCGRHVEQVLGDVPQAERCRCREADHAKGTKKRSVIDRLFGR